MIQVAGLTRIVEVIWPFQSTFTVSVSVLANLWSSILIKGNELQNHVIAAFQVLLPLLKSDLYTVMQSCVRGSLPAALPHFHQDMVAVAVVAVSGGYPGAYKKGLPILGK